MMWQLRLRLAPTLSSFKSRLKAFLHYCLPLNQFHGHNQCFMFPCLVLFLVWAVKFMGLNRCFVSILWSLFVSITLYSFSRKAIEFVLSEKLCRNQYAMLCLAWRFFWTLSAVPEWVFLPLQAALPKSPTPKRHHRTRFHHCHEPTACFASLNSRTLRTCCCQEHVMTAYHLVF